MYISLNEMFIGIIYLLLIALMIIGIIVLIKFNKIMKSIYELIDINKNNINRTCNEAPIIAENISEISENMKGISEVATDFTADIIVTKENISNNFEIFSDILKIIKSIFFN
ncbi:hypothetical protein NSA50_14320 [Clostridium sp. DSM 100503]|uniref:hypothetical protein n=1 Tax=Clostridium sp. DSM 100503 TaxID=2963282 RepID=UPI00214A5825|nr:hypothetical protein [Clostridium sp. DSM 100503]MCR1952209.1 hypothetical protein [Clostridium sp. DSM 100503]